MEGQCASEGATSTLHGSFWLNQSILTSLTPFGTHITVNHGPPPLVTWLLLSLEFDAAGWPLGTAVVDTSLLTLAVTAEGWGGATGGGILGEGFGGGRGGRGGGGE